MDEPNDSYLVGRVTQERPQFSLRAVLLLVLALCGLMAYGFQVDNLAAFSIRIMLPYVLPLFLASVFVKRPSRLGWCFIAIHTLAAGVILAVSGLKHGPQQLSFAVLIMWIDFPISSFYLILLGGDLGDALQAPHSGIVVLLAGGATWGSIGWLIGRARYAGTWFGNKAANRNALLTFAVHAILVIVVLAWCGLTTERSERAERLMWLVWIDFPVALFLSNIVIGLPYDTDPISPLQAFWLFTLGGVAWSTLLWLVTRACAGPTRKAMIDAMHERLGQQLPKLP